MGPQKITKQFPPDKEIGEQFFWVDDSKTEKDVNIFCGCQGRIARGKYFSTESCG
jgi:hypothetical protein